MLASIDHTLRDYGVSGDAMRWTPEPRPEPDPGREEGEPLWPWFYVMAAVIVGVYVLFVVMTL